QGPTEKERERSAPSVVQEVLAGIRVVKAFGQEFREQERFVSQSSAGVRARLRLAFVENGFGLLVGLTTAGGTAVVVSIGAHHVLSGRLTLGELLMVMAYLSQLYEPLKTISKKSASLQSHLANPKPSSCRIRCCSRRASARTSPTGGPPPATRKSSRPQRPPAPTTSSRAHGRGTGAGSVSAACSSQAESASASRSRAPT